MKLASLLSGVLVVLAGCATTAPSDDKVRSGFISNYSQLAMVDLGDDSNLQRYISPAISQRGYTRLLLDPISYFPAPAASDTIPRQVLSEISNYFNREARRMLSRHFQLVDQPGSNTLRMKLAITGLNIDDKPLAAYQYIPIAFIFTAAGGGLSEMSVKVQVEAEVVDSLTGEMLAAAVKQGKGETLKDDKTALTLDKVKPLIDTWVQSMDRTVGETFSAQRR